MKIFVEIYPYWAFGIAFTCNKMLRYDFPFQFKYFIFAILLGKLQINIGW